MPIKSDSSAIKNDPMEDLGCIIKCKSDTSTQKKLRSSHTVCQGPPLNPVIPP